MNEKMVDFSADDLEDWMRLADFGGSFDFWKDPEEQIYTLQDGEPLYSSITDQPAPDPARG
jgi:hypothetical protein